VTRRKQPTSGSANSASPEGMTAIAMGNCRVAEAPAPLSTPRPPDPTQVLTAPFGVTSRIRWFHESATSRFPFGASAMPIGWVNLAAAPWPSAKPWASAPEKPPASGETVPFWITRMRLLKVSET